MTWPAAKAGLGAMLLACLAACSERETDPPAPAASARPAPAPPAPRPRVLYLPDASPPAETAPARVPVSRGGRCPSEMVDVGGAFCIDRFEASLVDAATGRTLSPYYAPSPEATRREYRRWQRARQEAPTDTGRARAVPAPPEWALSATAFDPMATSVRGAVPNGYLSGEMAERACRRAGKRLCTPEEWVTACRGRQNRQFPYSHHYEERRCNVFRASHPGAILHGDPSVGHLDPRLNQLDEGGDPLLRPTGATPGCVSEWGADGVHDMVGNLDEWVDDPDGTFVGGFYARSTRQGCDSRVEVHSIEYYDYSLGARCCR